MREKARTPSLGWYFCKGTLRERGENTRLPPWDSTCKWAPVAEGERMPAPFWDGTYTCALIGGGGAERMPASPPWTVLTHGHPQGGGRMLPPWDRTTRAPVGGERMSAPPPFRMVLIHGHP